MRTSLPCHITTMLRHRKHSFKGTSSKGQSYGQDSDRGLHLDQ